jgi:hypothetical protein
MTSLRRHLASVGLAVVLCHVVMQVLVPAALCCQKTFSAAARAETRDCCPAGAHAGQICPMHGAKNAGKQQSKAPCHVRSQTDLHNLLALLTTGGVVPPVVTLPSPIGSESAPAPAEPIASFVSHVPLGPPPRA